MKAYQLIKQGLLLLALVFTTLSMAQFEGTKKADSLQFSLDAPNITSMNFSLLDANHTSSILDFKEKLPYLLGFKPQSQSYFNPNKKKTQVSRNFMQEKKPMDSDILVKRSFMGQDTSNNIGMKTDVSLGTFHTNTNKVRIEVRDFSLVDGDRIKVYVNEQVINRNIMLNATSFIINIDLRKGFNRIDVEALNQGYSGPNTAELRVYDEKGYLLSSQEWNIATGEIATLSVIKN